jgi:hypothetical protein
MTFYVGRFAEFSAAGFLASVIVHSLGLLGKSLPWGYSVFLLQFGATVAAFGAAGAVIVLLGSEGENFWRSALRACPAWIKWVTYFFAGYAVFNLVVFLNRFGNRGGLEPSQIMALVFRGVSGEWMAFYAGSFLIFFSAKRQMDRNARPGA